MENGMVPGAVKWGAVHAGCKRGPQMLAVTGAVHAGSNGSLHIPANN